MGSERDVLMPYVPLGWKAKHLPNGGARVTDENTGDTADCTRHPVFSMNVDQAVQEIRDRQ